jgi:hypothetical protein
MKSNRFSRLLAGCILCSVAGVSCAPSPVNNEAPNGLVATPHTITLAKATDIAVVSVVLKCGCTYRLNVTGFHGDTTAILYKPSTRFDTLVTPQMLRVYPATGVSKGTYKVDLDFFALDDGGLRFYDTVRVTLNMP